MNFHCGRRASGEDAGRRARGRGAAWEADDARGGRGRRRGVGGGRCWRRARGEARRGRWTMLEEDAGRRARHGRRTALGGRRGGTMLVVGHGAGGRRRWEEGLGGKRNRVSGGK
ncbi:hypothetical protein GUJ93_ZPchr0002g24264 [Zizania palustris]|uniref:Uncharacterized protein n=1 Tax=Zizania palustris TaxID=103762 RepID=A0A8J5S5Y0_ZIZPA|nr:hypothetical protein GUJ93_ZPchr0002g24264 [Zizania palustris]